MRSQVRPGCAPSRPPAERCPSTVSTFPLPPLCCCCLHVVFEHAPVYAAQFFECRAWPCGSFHINPARGRMVRPPHTATPWKFPELEISKDQHCSHIAQHPITTSLPLTPVELSLRLVTQDILALTVAERHYWLLTLPSSPPAPSSLQQMPVPCLRPCGAKGRKGSTTTSAGRIAAENPQSIDSSGVGGRGSGSG